MKQVGFDAAVVRDKVRGSLLGGAAGDALGYAVEFVPVQAILLAHGPLGITAYETDSWTGKAMISDDTQMTLFTANGILSAETCGPVCGERTAEYITKAYLDWLRTQETEDIRQLRGEERVSWLMDVSELYRRRAPGGTCLTSLWDIRDEGAERGSVAQHINESKGCGGVMRAAPMGLRCPPDGKYGSIEDMDRMGAELAAITHGHSLGYMPAAVLTHIVNRLVYPQAEMTLKEIVLEARDTVARIFAEDEYIEELTQLIDLAVKLVENDDSDLNNIDLLGGGWVGEEALAIAIYCSLRYQEDFSGGLIAAVNHDGDSDSTGAIAGNILGALVGLDGIEDKWKTDLELADVVLEMADDLFAGCRRDETGSCEADWERKYVQMKWKPGEN